MPTVNVDQEQLFAALGRTYSADEFRDLCFEYGIELDEVTSELDMMIAQIGKEAAHKLPQKLSERPLFKIDIPANRIDLLCAESIIRALRVFLGQTRAPRYIFNDKHPRCRITVTACAASPATEGARPVIVAAVVRNVRFTPRALDSFIQLQEKLHANICRKRSLASLGTHDLDRLGGSLRGLVYDFKDPKDIHFVALNEELATSAEALVARYRCNSNNNNNNKYMHLCKYLHLIERREARNEQQPQLLPRVPVFYDGAGDVASLPPVINSEKTRISIDTRNVFVECTATDRARAEAALAATVAMLGELQEKEHEDVLVDAVEIVTENVVEVTPCIDSRPMAVSCARVSSLLGIVPALRARAMRALLARMGYHLDDDDDADNTDVDVVNVRVPMSRGDVLHEVDVAEDVGIAYGYTRLTPRMPPASTVAVAQPLARLSDCVRGELASAGFIEVLPLVLTSVADLTTRLGLSAESTQSTQSTASTTAPVLVANPRTADCEALRTRLLPGLLRTLRENRAQPLPLRVFEVGDVAYRDDSAPRRSRNERHVAAAHGGTRSAFEAMHGLLDLLSLKLNHDAPAQSPAQSLALALAPLSGSEAAGEMFLRGMAADVVVAATKTKIGVLGVLHPHVLARFGLSFPVTVLEMNLEVFL